MVRHFPLVLLLITCVALPRAWANEQRPALTNSDIVRLVKSGVSERLVLVTIQSSPTAFDLSPQALIELKSNGVPDAVIGAMVSASKRATTESPTPASPPRPRSPSLWVRDYKNISTTRDFEFERSELEKVESLIVPPNAAYMPDGYVLDQSPTQYPSGTPVSVSLSVSEFAYHHGGKNDKWDQIIPYSEISSIELLTLDWLFYWRVSAEDGVHVLRNGDTELKSYNTFVLEQMKSERMKSSQEDCALALETLAQILMLEPTTDLHKVRIVDRCAH